MDVSSVNIVEPKGLGLGKRRNQHDRFTDYLTKKADRDRPFYGHECLQLRKQLRCTAKQLATMIDCHMSVIFQNEQQNLEFGSRLAYKLNRLRRYANLAQADLRDRFEMPDFHR